MPSFLASGYLNFQHKFIPHVKVYPWLGSSLGMCILAKFHHFFLHILNDFFYYTIERHEDEIETAFARKTSKDFENEVCFKISNACTNVDRSKKAKDVSDIDLTTDGKTKKVQKEVKIDAQTGTAKTLSKKDKKAKKVKKQAKKEKPMEQIKKAGGDVFQVDINDPDSMSKVLAQIKQVTEDHKKDFYQKQAEEDGKKSKDELWFCCEGHFLFE